MFFGIVIGQVVADRKECNLESRRLLVVRQLDDQLNETKKTYVCVDVVSARRGDIVLTCGSSSARMTAQTQNTCTDNAVIAVVERVSFAHKDTYARD